MSSKRTTLATAPAAFRRPVRTAHIPLGLDGYPEHIGATMRINLTMGEYEALSADWRSMLRKIILSWNLVDGDGKPAELDDQMSGATDEELIALLRGYYAQMHQRVTLPNESELLVTTSG